LHGVVTAFAGQRRRKEPLREGIEHAEPDL
jgi:hypothetical protein